MQGFAVVALTVVVSLLPLLAYGDATAIVDSEKQVLPSSRIEETDEGLPPSRSSRTALSRQRRNPVLVAAAVRVGVRVGAKYAVRIGNYARNFKSHKAVKNFLSQPSTLRRISNLPKSGGNIVSVPSRGFARYLTKQLVGKNGRYVYHRNPVRGNRHYHPLDSMGKKSHIHISHP